MDLISKFLCKNKTLIFMIIYSVFILLVEDAPAESTSQNSIPRDKLQLVIRLEVPEHKGFIDIRRDKKKMYILLHNCISHDYCMETPPIIDAEDIVAKKQSVENMKNELEIKESFLEKIELYCDHDRDYDSCKAHEKDILEKLKLSFKDNSEVDVSKIKDKDSLNDNISILKKNCILL